MQFDLLNRIFGALNKTKLMLATLGFIVVLGGFVALTVFRSSSGAARSPALAQYLRFCSYLASRGCARLPGETPMHYLERISRLNPQWANDMKTITDIFTELAFTSEGKDTAKLRKLRATVRRFRMIN